MHTLPPAILETESTLELRERKPTNMVLWSIKKEKKSAVESKIFVVVSAVEIVQTSKAYTSVLEMVAGSDGSDGVIKLRKKPWTKMK